MSSRWTSKYAILQDLAIVQGCVPGDIEGTLRTGEKPPAPDLLDETEEEFYRKFVACDNGSASAANFQPIKMFLDMVHGDSSSEEEIESQCNGKVLVSKLNPLSSEFVPKSMHGFDKNNNDTEVRNSKQERKKNTLDFNRGIIKTRIFTRTSTPNFISDKSDKFSDVVTVNSNNKNDGGIIKVQKIKNKRNIALESILEMEAQKMSTENCIIDKTVGISPVTPVTQVKKSVTNISPILWDSSSMFKQKDVVKKEQVISKSAEKFEIVKVPTIKQYVPSKRAFEYYKKYTERSHIKKIWEEIWKRAERVMIELELKWKIEAELKALEESFAGLTITDIPTDDTTENTTQQKNGNVTFITQTENSTVLHENTTEQDNVNITIITDNDDSTVRVPHENTTEQENFKNTITTQTDKFTALNDNTTEQENGNITITNQIDDFTVLHKNTNRARKW